MKYHKSFIKIPRERERERERDAGPCMYWQISKDSNTYSCSVLLQVTDRGTLQIGVIKLLHEKPGSVRQKVTCLGSATPLQIGVVKLLRGKPDRVRQQVTCLGSATPLQIVVVKLLHGKPGRVRQQLTCLGSATLTARYRPLLYISRKKRRKQSTLQPLQKTNWLVAIKMSTLCMLFHHSLIVIVIYIYIYYILELELVSLHIYMESVTNVVSCILARGDPRKSSVPRGRWREDQDILVSFLSQ